MEARMTPVWRTSGGNQNVLSLRGLVMTDATPPQDHPGAGCSDLWFVYRKKRSTKANENEYTSSDTYDTKLDAMR